jgi:uncharacterized protein YjdB
MIVTISSKPVLNAVDPICVGGETQASLSSSPTLPTGGTWTSADPSIATVDANGKVKGVSAGDTRITYTNAAGCTSDFYDVKVEALPTTSPIKAN